MWISIELNMLAFLPIICLSVDSSLESGLKYFLIQGWGSAIFMFTIILRYRLFRVERLIIAIMVLKLGGAPFHGWFVSLLGYIGPKIYLILATIQKLIPFLIISVTSYRKYMVFYVVFFSIVIIYINMSFMSIIKILAFSSVNSINWILIGILTRYGIFLLFFIIYFVILLGIVILVRVPGNSIFIGEYNIGGIQKILLLFIFITLGGVPPFLGFIAKLIVIKASIIWVTKDLLVTILIRSFIILFIYLRYSHTLVSYYPMYSQIVYSKHIIYYKVIYFMLLHTIWATSLLFI